MRPLHECIDKDVDLDDRDGKPAMGIHRVNGALLDGTIDAHPSSGSGSSRPQHVVVDVLGAYG